MESMIERVAKAIYEKRDGAGCKPWSIQTKAHRGPYLDDAIAAIEAMRGPTPSMVEAGHIRDPLGCDVEHAESVYPVVWDAMIDAALKETTNA